MRLLFHWLRARNIQRRAAAEAEASEARRMREEAAQDRLAAEMESRQASERARRLRRELERNGWTDLLRESWGGGTA